LAEDKTQLLPAAPACETHHAERTAQQQQRAATIRQVQKGVK
jgi:hypothetical protein